jgi:hypothetical protein
MKVLEMMRRKTVNIGRWYQALADLRARLNREGVTIALVLVLGVCKRKCAFRYRLMEKVI